MPGATRRKRCYTQEMRAVWAIVVVCLMAFGGVAPARGAAAHDDRSGEHARELRGGHPALPALTGERSAAVSVALRARPPLPQLPPGVVPVPPVVRGAVGVSALAAAQGTRLDPSITPALRSARGPPV
ncbi:MAG TPA: hypothetical protein VGC42_20385 [Kofleriaceae bacterium]